jgi:queuine tRNA-ribosyltransferase
MQHSSVHGTLLIDTPFGSSAHGRKSDQNLFGIIQGGLDPQLRELCLKGREGKMHSIVSRTHIDVQVTEKAQLVSIGVLFEFVMKRTYTLGMLQRDADLPGYAIGGLAGGEDKNYFWRTVKQVMLAIYPKSILKAVHVY